MSKLCKCTGFKFCKDKMDTRGCMHYGIHKSTNINCFSKMPCLLIRKNVICKKVDQYPFINED